MIVHIFCNKQIVLLSVHIVAIRCTCMTNYLCCFLATESGVYSKCTDIANQTDKMSLKPLFNSHFHYASCEDFSMQLTVSAICMNINRAAEAEAQPLKLYRLCCSYVFVRQHNIMAKNKSLAPLFNSKCLKLGKYFCPCVCKGERVQCSAKVRLFSLRVRQG